jgi:hypothetical protein
MPERIALGPIKGGEERILYVNFHGKVKEDE